MESVVYKLAMMAARGSHEGLPRGDLVAVQRALAVVTETRPTSIVVDEDKDSDVSLYKRAVVGGPPPQVEGETLKALLEMQISVEAALGEYALARQTIARLKDVLSDYGEDPAALMGVIVCKARVLYGEYRQLDAVEEYVREAGELVVRSWNARSNVGEPASFSDLYPLRRELVRLRVEHALNSGDRRDALIKKVELMWGLVKDRAGDVESLAEIAETYVALGQFEEALWVVGEVLGFEPNYVEGWSLRGEICFLIATKSVGASKGPKSGPRGGWLDASLDCHLRAIELMQGHVRSLCGALVVLTQLAEQAVLSDQHQKIRGVICSAATALIDTAKGKAFMSRAERCDVRNLEWALGPLKL